MVFIRTVKGIVSKRNGIPKGIIQPDYAKNGLAPQMRDSIPLLNNLERLEMKKACKMAGKVLNFAGSLVQPGISTDAIDRQVHKFVLGHGVYPSPMNYCGFPKSICTSVNDVIVHGIPDSRKLEDGDIVNIDVSTYLPNGYHGDTSRTFLSGQVDEDGKRLVQVNELALAEAIKRCGPGVPFNLIGSVIQDISDAHGFSSVRDFTGHGIGKQFHLKPFILHYRNNEPGVMEPGMVFTIEPMFCEGEMHGMYWEDGWTVATRDGKRSAQCEHTILITESGSEILTVDDQVFPRSS